MSDEVLEAYIRSYSKANRNNPAGILFTWQGGEPTLMGLDFFKKAVELRKEVRCRTAGYKCAADKRHSARR